VQLLDARSAFLRYSVAALRFEYDRRIQAATVTRGRLVSLFVFAFVFSASARSHSQDRIVAIPDMQVLLQNEHVRVQFHDVAVGETTAIHSHPAYVAYVFNEYTGKQILPDGTEIPLARTPGDVFYSGPTTHRIVNTGKTPIHNLIVELKTVTK